jgi:hypothetical protein
MTKKILFFASIILIYSACSTKMNVQEAKRRYDAGEYAVADRLYGLAEKDVPDATRMRARCKFEMKDITLEGYESHDAIKAPMAV